MFITEPVTIKDIRVSDRYPYVRIITFKDRLYKVILASNDLFDVGEEVLYIPDGSVLPDYLLKRLGFWDTKYNHGVLAGYNQNIIKSYLYARDPDYLSSGIILKAQNGLIRGLSDTFDIHTPEIDKKLGIRYITRKDLSYFMGDIFLQDVSIQKTHLLDLEYMHSQLENQYVEYEELVKGRKFYISLCKYKSHHHAAGNFKNVYVTTDTLGKYRFLSNTKENVNSNIIYKSALNLKLIERIEKIMRENSLWNILTLGFVLRSTAYSGHFPKDYEINQNTVCVDAYIGEIPRGRYLNQSEFRELCKKYGFKVPKYFGEGTYDLDLVQDLLDKNYGVAIKATDGKIAAGAYSQEAKLRFIRSHTK